MNEVNRYSTPDTVAVLVANKLDLASERQVSTEEG